MEKIEFPISHRIMLYAIGGIGLLFAAFIWWR